MGIFQRSACPCNKLQNPYRGIQLKNPDGNSSVSRDRLGIRTHKCDNNPRFPDIGTGDVLSLKRVGIKPIVLKEETSIHLKGISIRDVDCKPDQELLELSMNSHYGYLHLPQQAFARQWIAGDRRVSQEIIVRSTVNEINQVSRY